LALVAAVRSDEYDALKTWLRAGGAIFDKIDIKEFDNYGRGLVATADIQPGQVVLSIPWSLALTPANIEHRALHADSEHVTELHRTAVQELLWYLEDQPLGATDEMALLLLNEQNNPNSYWRAYLDILPRSYSTSYYFSAEELQELQQSKLKEFTERRRAGVERHWQSISEGLLDVIAPDTWQVNITKSGFEWALSVIWSRMFALQSDHADGALVPLADLANAASPQSRAEDWHVTVSTDEERFTYKANVFIPEGTQILIPYATNKRLSNAEYLLEYGFTFPRNMDDVVVFEFDLAPRDKHRESKRELLARAGIKHAQFLVRRGVAPNELLTAARVHHMTGTELRDEQYRDRIARQSPVHELNEKSALTTVLTRAKQVLRQYTTSIDEDRALLKSGTLTDTLRNIVLVRMSEKEILTDMIDQIQDIKSSRWSLRQ
jgi:hypothetical protein